MGDHPSSPTPSTLPDPSSPPLPAPLLTSVAAIVQQLNGLTSPSAEAFQEKMCFVGVIDASSFLIQYDLHLLVVDTRQMAKEFVFQSIFRRWAITRLPRLEQYTAVCGASSAPLTSTGAESSTRGRLESRRPPPSLSTAPLLDASVLPPPPLSFCPPRKDDSDTVPDSGLSVESLLLVALGRDLRGLSAERYLSDELVQLLQSSLSTDVHDGPPPSSASFHVPSCSHGNGMSWKEKQNLVRLVACDALILLFEPVTGTVDHSHSSSPTPVPKKSTARFVRRLTARLIHWRHMLALYFGIRISRSGVLEELPQEMAVGGRRLPLPPVGGGKEEPQQTEEEMGRCFWRPHLTLVPLLLLRIADCVPYPFASPSFSSSSSFSESASWEKHSEKKMKGSTLATTEKSLEMAENAREEVVGQSREEDPARGAASPSSTETDCFPTTTTAIVAQEACAEEVGCLTTIARHMAEVLYGIAIPVGDVEKAPHDACRTAASSPPTVDRPPHRLESEEEEAAAKQERIARERGARYRQQVIDAVQHGLFPCLKQKKLFKLPSDCLINGTIQHIVSVDALYKVFERC